MNQRRVGVVAVSLAIASVLSGQTQRPDSVPAIVDQIGKLESARDPKCYATASRLEDFIYGTPLETTARFEKIALQKRLIRAFWEKASAASTGQITVETLRPVIQQVIPYKQTANGDWEIEGMSITARDKRQYGSIAYALRALLAVQQDVLLDPASHLLPLDSGSVELMKEAIDLATLAALQQADAEARRLNKEKITTPMLTAAWWKVVPQSVAAGVSPPDRRPVEA